MGKKQPVKEDPRLKTEAGRRAYAGFMLRTGMLFPGESVAPPPRQDTHPPEVYESIMSLIKEIGSPDPRAFLAVWTAEEIIPELTVILESLNQDADGRIRNPAGLLWTNLSTRYPKAVMR